MKRNQCGRRVSASTMIRRDCQFAAWEDENILLHAHTGRRRQRPRLTRTAVQCSHPHRPAARRRGTAFAPARRPGFGDPQLGRGHLPSTSGRAGMRRRPRRQDGSNRDRDKPENETLERLYAAPRAEKLAVSVRMVGRGHPWAGPIGNQMRVTDACPLGDQPDGDDRPEVAARRP
jgi:hypothetical protein